MVRVEEKLVKNSPSQVHRVVLARVFISSVKILKNLRDVRNVEEVFT